MLTVRFFMFVVFITPSLPYLVAELLNAEWGLSVLTTVTYRGRWGLDNGSDIERCFIQHEAANSSSAIRYGKYEVKMLVLYLIRMFELYKIRKDGVPNTMMIILVQRTFYWNRIVFKPMSSRWITLSEY